MTRRSTISTLIDSALIGGATGILSMTGVAAVLTRIPARKLPGFLTKPWVRPLAQASMAGEWAINAFATSIPPRTDPGPLGGRIVLGAACAATLAHASKRPMVPAAAVGGLAAGLSATAATVSRARLSNVVPDLLIAFAETVVAVAMARKSTRE